MQAGLGGGSRAAEEGNQMNPLPWQSLTRSYRNSPTGGFLAGAGCARRPGSGGKGRRAAPAEINSDKG